MSLSSSEGNVNYGNLLQTGPILPLAMSGTPVNKTPMSSFDKGLSLLVIRCRLGLADTLQARLLKNSTPQKLLIKGACPLYIAFSFIIAFLFPSFSPFVYLTHQSQMLSATGKI